MLRELDSDEFALVSGAAPQGGQAVAAGAVAGGIVGFNVGSKAGPWGAVWGTAAGVVIGGVVGLMGYDIGNWVTSELDSQFQDVDSMFAINDFSDGFEANFS